MQTESGKERFQMTKLKKLFSTPKKTVATITGMVVLIALLGTGTVFAAGAVAESTAIGTENAQKFAFADAGIDPLSAGNVRTEFDYEHGQFIYEVDFAAGDSEYEYWIKASDGTVVKKQVERIARDGSDAAAAAEITVDKAKEIALADAGVSSSDATFIKEKPDYDDGIPVYDVEFYTSSHEYDYEIDARTGAVRSRDMEALEIAPQQQGSSNGNYIGVQKAKSIALDHAGVSDVTYTKAKLDEDDGQVVYEIEFYKDGVEYDYTIRAVDGSILEYDSEWD